MSLSDVDRAQRMLGEDQEDEGEAKIVNDHYQKDIKRVRMAMYNFGTPRVGNWHFAREMNRWVPNSFRVG